MLVVMLYFAYGSNLNTRDRQSWCARNEVEDFLPEAAGVGYLPDMEPVFHYRSSVRQGGALDVRRRRGQLTPGGLFEVDARGWELLDRKERAPDYYRRRPVQVLTDCGKVLPAVTYEVVPERTEGFVKPTSEYVETVCQGLWDLGLTDLLLGATAKGDSPVPWLVDGVFVYGTLMRGECRHQSLQGDAEVHCTGPARTSGRLLDLGDFPGLIPAVQQGEQVLGEYYQVADVGRTLGILDEIEEFRGYGVPGSLYTRVLTRVDVGAGVLQMAWTYHLAEIPYTASVIQSGSWRGRAKS